MNVYAYVGNDPLNFTDRFGLAAEGGGYDFSAGPVMVAASGGGTRSRATSPSSPAQEIGAGGVEIRYQQLLRQIQTVNPNFQAPATIGPPGAGRSAGEVQYLESVLQARQRYPNEPQRMEQHHVTPLYLGGTRSGPTVPLDAAQHETLTQQMRQQMPFGQQPPSPAQVQQFLQDFYSRNPLPPGVMEQYFPKRP